MKEHKAERRKKDKANFSTVDKVLDRNTMAILAKLEKREKIFDMSGAVSSGKEANIYTARCSTSLISKLIQEGAEQTEEIVPVVLKIYKTSTMLFKDRDRYIVDEKRFTNFCTSNSRKLIKVWAEKEVRNLKRMAKHGIPCPRPLYLKRSILVLTMIGDDAPAARLKDAAVADWQAVYDECIGILHALYQKAGLVHADFSEYNLIYHQERVHVIDVGQSVEKNHGNANNFLLLDIRNCNDFFARHGVALRSEIEIFESITGMRIPQYLKKDGKLSRDTFIPSRITEVVNREDFELFVLSGDDAERANGSEETPDADSDDSGLSNSLDGDSATSDSAGAQSEGESSGSKTAGDPLVEIDIFRRKLRIDNPDISPEAEREYNKKRKQLVKEMNKERRSMRSLKTDKIKDQKAKKAVKSLKKRST